ncbi:MAG: hypothetical protein ABI663_08275 [Chryseolinea sp.]
MKTKVIILIAISAVVTLSFTFASKRTAVSSKHTISNSADEKAPLGGFVSEDKF